MSTLFLSHSSKDNLVMEKLANQLKQVGFDSFFLDFYPDQGIPAGRDWETEIYKNIRHCSVVLFLCSSDSIESKWCFAELAMSRAFPKTIFPIRIDDSNLPDIVSSKQAIKWNGESNEELNALIKELVRIIPDPERIHYDANRCPYPGMASFDAEDEAVFFGRAKEIKELRENLDNLQRNETGIGFLNGASGTGKSSLINAGLLPCLRRQPEQWTVLKPTVAGPGALRELAKQFSSFFKNDPEENFDSIVKTITTVTSSAQSLQNDDFPLLLNKIQLQFKYSDTKILWVIDQAERLLDEGKETTKVLNFIANLDKMSNQTLLVLIVLRTDHYDAFLGHPAIVNNTFNKKIVWLEPLGISAFRSIIKDPVRRVNIDIQPKLIDELIECAKALNTLPLLAFILRELWDKAKERSEEQGIQLKEIIDSDFQSIGKLEGCLTRKIEQIMDDLFKIVNEDKNKAHSEHLVKQKQLLLKTISRMARLVQLGEKNEVILSKPLPWEEIPGEIKPGIHRLINERLLKERTDGVEVIHEIIFQVWKDMKSTLEGEIDVLRWRRRVEDQLNDWIKHDKSIEKVHLSGIALTEAKELLKKHQESLTQNERNFIEMSLELAHNEELRWQNAYSRQLAAQALTITHYEAELTEQGIILAVESMKRCTKQGIASLEADQALRTGISIAARRVIDFKTKTEVDSGAIAIHPAAPIITFGEKDGTTYFWNLEKNEIIENTKFNESITQVEYSTNGKWLVFGDRGGELQLIDVEKGKIKPLPNVNLKSPVHAICFSRDDNLLAVAFHNKVYIWEIGIGTQQKPVVLKLKISNPIVCLDFNPGGDILVTQEVMGETHIWEWKKKHVVGHFEIMGNYAEHSPDGRYLGVCSASMYTAILWDIATQTETKLATNAAQLAFSPDGQLVGIASPEHFARIWKLPELTPVHTFRHNAEVWNLEFSPDSLRLLTWTKNNVAHVWDIVSGKEVARMINSDHINSARFLPDSRYVLTHDNSNTLRLWDTQELRQFRRIRHTVAVLGVAFSPDGKFLATNARSGWGELAPQLIDIASQQPVFKVPLSEGGEKDGIEYATQILEAHDAESRKTVSNKNNGIVAEAEGSIVKLFQDSTAGKLLQTLPHNHDVSSIVFSPDGNYLATASDHDSCRIWDVQSGQEVSRLTHDNPNVVDVDFSPDGRFIATASWDHTARIWLWQPDDLILEAGSRVSRNLTVEEWQRYLPEEPYRETFPEFGSSSQSDASSEKNIQEVSDE